MIPFLAGFAIIGYVVALKTFWWMQLFVVGGIVAYLQSDHFKYSELMGLFYLSLVWGFLVGLCAGDVVSVIAHPQKLSFLGSAFYWLFTP
jgi:hypothetical protein